MHVKQSMTQAGLRFSVSLAAVESDLGLVLYGHFDATGAHTNAQRGSNFPGEPDVTPEQSRKRPLLIVSSTYDSGSDTDDDLGPLTKRSCATTAPVDTQLHTETVAGAKESLPIDANAPSSTAIPNLLHDGGTREDSPPPPATATTPYTRVHTATVAGTIGSCAMGATGEDVVGPSNTVTLDYEDDAAPPAPAASYPQVRTESVTGDTEWLPIDAISPTSTTAVYPVLKVSADAPELTFYGVFDGDDVGPGLEARGIQHIPVGAFVFVCQDALFTQELHADFVKTIAAGRSEK